MLQRCRDLGALNVRLDRLFVLWVDPCFVQAYQFFMISLVDIARVAVRAFLFLAMYKLVTFLLDLSECFRWVGVLLCFVQVEDLLSVRCPCAR